VLLCLKPFGVNTDGGAEAKKQGLSFPLGFMKYLATQKHPGLAIEHVGGATA